MTDLQAALTALELRESELLAWGAVGAQWTRDEAIEVLAEHGDAEGLFAELESRGLLVETPTAGYRTRSAETVRLLATLRQAFRSERILSGRPLVLDYRFLQRPRRRPKRDIAQTDFVADWVTTVGESRSGHRGSPHPRRRCQPSRSVRPRRSWRRSTPRTRGPGSW